MSKSDFPSFDDFIARYDEASIAKWTDGANAVALEHPIQLPLDENNVQSFALTLCAMSNQIALAMLRDYHEWLREQLEKKSVRLI